MQRLLLVAFRLLYWCGAPTMFRFIHRNTLTIVLYHGVAPAHPHGIYNYRGKFVAPDVFERQIRYMRTHYTVLPVDEALRRLNEGTLPKYALAITFDDGYRNFFEFAYPVLSPARTPVTMYLATDFVCRGRPLWVDRLEYALGAGSDSFSEKAALDARTRAHLKTLDPGAREAELQRIENAAGVKLDSFDGDRSVYAPLSRAEIIAMHGSGVTYGAHTRSHPILATQDAATQEAEIVGSKIDIEALGVPVSTVFAYPNGQDGDWNDETERILASSGFTHALSTHEGVHTRRGHRYRVNRIALDNIADIATFANILSGVRLFVKSLL